MGAFLSACEQRSVKAERQIKAIKKARFMAKLLGQEFEGLVSSVTKFGVFVILRQFDVDGLVRLESLPGDRFEFDEENMRLVGRRSGHVIAVGDLMQIQVAAADTEEGRIDFVPAGTESPSQALARPTAGSRERVQKPALKGPRKKDFRTMFMERKEKKENRGLHFKKKDKPSSKRSPSKGNSKRLRKKRFSSGR